MYPFLSFRRCFLLLQHRLGRGTPIKTRGCRATNAPKESPNAYLCLVLPHRQATSGQRHHQAPQLPQRAMYPFFRFRRRFLLLQHRLGRGTPIIRGVQSHQSVRAFARRVPVTRTTSQASRERSTSSQVHPKCPHVPCILFSSFAAVWARILNRNQAKNLDFWRHTIQNYFDLVFITNESQEKR